MTVATERRGAYRDGNSTADRALTILQMFSEQQDRVSANDIAEHLGVSRSTAYRYAQSLVRSEFLVEESGTGFRLGPKVMELARVARRSYGLSDMAIPIMRQLAAKHKETVLLTRRVGTGILCLEREEWPGQYVRLSYERGTRLSLNAGASALVLLAWLPEDYVREILSGVELYAYTENTLTKPDSILERLAQIRVDGYCIAYGEVDPDVLGIAAPVFDNQGDVSAALSLVTLRTRLTPEAIKTTTRSLVTSAADLTAQIHNYSE